jgi:Plasmid replication region DNA-binding N-term
VTESPISYGLPLRGITSRDVELAADALLREGERPTIERVRERIGRGSPNTINPMLDAWWKTLSSRLDAGPAALHRLPEPIAHIAEALWMQALEESRRRIAIEQRDSARVADLDKQRLELRSHVLTLREGELDSRLHERERTIADLQLQVRGLTGLLRKEQATRESLTRSLTTPDGQIRARRKTLKKPTRSRTPAAPKRKAAARRAAPHRNSAKRKVLEPSNRKRKRRKRG